MNKNARLFLSYVLPSMVGCSSSVPTVSWIPFIAGVQENSGFASVAVTWPLVMMFGAVGDMLGTGAAIIIAQSRGSGNLRLARLSLGNMLVWQVLFSLADDDCRQMFSDRYTPSVRRYRRTDARRRALFADFDIRQSGLYAGNRRAGGNP